MMGMANGDILSNPMKTGIARWADSGFENGERYTERPTPTNAQSYIMMNLKHVSSAEHQTTKPASTGPLHMQIGSWRCEFGHAFAGPYKWNNLRQSPEQPGYLYLYISITI